jgi:DNA-binding transcriptional regulator YhcF (GntR family)
MSGAPDATDQDPGDPGVLVTLDPASGVPPSEQIRAQITGTIDGGHLSPGTRLPTVRALAADLGVAANTAARAYRELERQGLITTEGRHGTFVAGEPSVVRQQAALEARAFVTRMRGLGIGRSEMLAILRREADRLAGGTDDA